jgi:hypothetical protein
MGGTSDAGGRQNGWELLREQLQNVTKLEGPRPFVFTQCRQFIRTVPALLRDETDLDDVDTQAADHETCYRQPPECSSLSAVRAHDMLLMHSWVPYYWKWTASMLVECGGT